MLFRIPSSSAVKISIRCLVVEFLLSLSISAQQGMALHSNFYILKQNRLVYLSLSKARRMKAVRTGSSRPFADPDTILTAT